PSIHMARLNNDEESRRPDLMREVSAVIFDSDSGKLSRINRRSSARKGITIGGVVGDIWIGRNTTGLTGTHGEHPADQ
ncbi:MAG: hypothetical protein ACRD2L_06595, partial [Terriglobia bacterium]